MNIRLGRGLERPTFIFIDDLEDDETVLNEDQRKKVRSWFAGSLLNCVSKKRPEPRKNRWTGFKRNPTGWQYPWRVFYTDTLKHQDAQMAHILQSGRWRSVVFPQSELRFDETEGKKRLFSCVPELISHEQARSEYSYAESEG